jgi:hypothetical protein
VVKRLYAAIEGKFAEWMNPSLEKGQRVEMFGTFKAES